MKVRALHIAVRNKRLAVVELLISMGCDVFARYERYETGRECSKTAREIAVGNRSQDILAILKLAEKRANEEKSDKPKSDEPGNNGAAKVPGDLFISECNDERRNKDDAIFEAIFNKEQDERWTDHSATDDDKETKDDTNNPIQCQQS